MLVAALENEGVQRIFGVPGEENLDVIESLHRAKKFPMGSFRLNDKIHVY